MKQIYKYNGQELELPDANTWQYGDRMEYAVWPRPTKTMRYVESLQDVRSLVTLLFRKQAMADGSYVWARP